MESYVSKEGWGKAEFYWRAGGEEMWQIDFDDDNRYLLTFLYRRLYRNVARKIRGILNEGSETPIFYKLGGILQLERPKESLASPRLIEGMQTSEGESVASIVGDLRSDTPSINIVIVNCISAQDLEAKIEDEVPTIISQ